jgi:hypothetical protein
MMQDSVVARIAGLRATPTPALRDMWRDLFDSDPPRYNRRFLESPLACRIQELAYGDFNPKTIKRLEALGEQLDAGNITVPRARRRPADCRYATDPGIPKRRAQRDGTGGRF